MQGWSSLYQLHCKCLEKLKSSVQVMLLHFFINTIPPTVDISDIWGSLKGLIINEGCTFHSLRICSLPSLQLTCKYEKHGKSSKTNYVNGTKVRRQNSNWEWLFIRVCYAQSFLTWVHYTSTWNAIEVISKLMVSKVSYLGYVSIINKLFQQCRKGCCCRKEILHKFF